MPCDKERAAASEGGNPAVRCIHRAPLGLARFHGEPVRQHVSKQFQISVPAARGRTEDCLSWATFSQSWHSRFNNHF